MATIYGPKTGHATLHDTSGNDTTVIAAGGDNTIIDSAGNDTISAGSIGGNLILAGTPGDGSTRSVNIHVNGRGNTIYGGDANFTITGWAGSSDISLGNGTNSITALGPHDTVTIGLGHDAISLGTAGLVVGDSTVIVVGASGGTGSQNGGVADITFNGTGNTFVNDTTGQDGCRLAVTTQITGGTGHRHFTLWGGGSVLTGGTDNVIAVTDGTYHVVAGSGADTVELNPTGAHGTLVATVSIDGTGDVVTGNADTATILGGLGNATITLGQPASGQGNYIVHLDGAQNTVTATDATGRIDAGGSDAIVNLQDAGIQVFTHGTADFIGLGEATSGTIADQSNGLLVNIGGTDVHETIVNFGYDRGAVVKVDFGGDASQPFANAAQVLAAVTNTAAGAVLSFNGGADTITFAGLFKGQLSTGNFAV
jgi:hypothetical protein